MDINEILSIFERRRSVRKFKTDKVADELIEKIIYAASLSPSARNIQPWKFIIIKNEDIRAEIARLAIENGSFLKESPVCIAVVCENTKYYLEDGSAATTQMLLCAAGLGLGACWVAADKKEYCPLIEKALNIPQDMKLVSLVALGYPKETPEVIKKPLGELIFKERY